jgi:CBS domain-containing protein
VETPPDSPVPQLAVSEIMRDAFLMVDGMNTVRDVLTILNTHPVRCLVVYKRHDADEYGLLLVSDIGRKVLATGRRPERINVYEIMTKPAITVTPDTSIVDCARLFARCGISRAPVVGDDGKIVGIVSLNDLVLRGLLPHYVPEDGSGDGEAPPVETHQAEQPGPEQHAEE